MGNVSRKARSAMGMSSDWRNLIDPYEYLAYTLVNRATTDYTRVMDQIDGGQYADETPLKNLKARRQALRAEFTEPAYLTARMGPLLPAFGDMDGEDCLDRLDAAKREQSK